MRPNLLGIVIYYGGTNTLITGVLFEGPLSLSVLMGLFLHKDICKIIGLHSLNI